MTVIIPRDISKRLKKSLRWVYAHALELGAVRIGGSVIFTEEALENALQRGESAQGSCYVERRKASAVMPDKERGRRMGGSEEEGAQGERKAAAARHGLADLLY